MNAPTLTRPSVLPADIDRMRANLFVVGSGDGVSRFWGLLVLASIIASAGVVADSTATVIGAMIVAPLMTPILGIVLAVVTGDRRNLAASLGLVAGGAALAIAIGYVIGVVVPIDQVADTNTQIAGRVEPGLIDLLAALATGTVGAFAQCRRDIGDALPGVAIAISLVPPLVVVGLTLESGAGVEAAGALLLFLTNVAAILVTGVIVMVIYRVHLTASATGPVRLRRAAVTMGVMLTLVALPLAASTVRIGLFEVLDRTVEDVVSEWVEGTGWNVESIDRPGARVVVKVAGPEPAPDTAALRRLLDERGLGSLDVEILLIPEERVVLEGS